MLNSSPKFLTLFISFHGLFFLGGGYVFSYVFPDFAIIHSGIGIITYMLWWKTIFPHLFIEAFVGAVISVLFGVLFGDIFLSNFYFLIEAENIIFLQRIYSMLFVFYIYFYIRLIQRAVFYKDAK